MNGNSKTTIIDDLSPQEALAIANTRKEKAEREVAKDIEALFKGAGVWEKLQALETRRKIARLQANRAAYIAEIEKVDAELEELTGKKVAPLRPVAAKAGGEDAEKPEDAKPAKK